MEPLFDPRVAVTRDAFPYPARPPWSPPERYPEFPHARDEAWDPSNRVYPAVRRLLHALGLDRERFGTAAWNPLGAIVRPGDRVLLKPNYILHQHLSGKDPFSVVTHSSVVRAVLDYVLIALGGRGSVTVADAPQANADWERILAVTRIAETLGELERLHGVQVGLRDLRMLRVVQKNGITVGRTRTDAQAVLVEMGERSALAPLGGSLGNLCGSDYDRHRTVESHARGHRYAAALPVIEADVLVSLPKLKVHKKTGVSLNLKNMVGINADKNFIPHYRVGDARSGGDEFPVETSPLGRVRDRLARGAIDVVLGRFDRVSAPALAAAVGAWHRRSSSPDPATAQPAAHDPTDAGYNQSVIRHVYARLLGKPVRAGNWSGNDTLWRAVLDLNRVALYGKLDGELATAPVRRYFSVIDGVVGGEREGPMDPEPVPAGLLIGGFNPVLVDLVATLEMGLDPARIPLLAHALDAADLPLAPAAGVAPVVSGDPAPAGPRRAFAPPSGWPEAAPSRAPAA